jgi:hypothetical protein
MLPTTDETPVGDGYVNPLKSEIMGMVIFAFIKISIKNKISLTQMGKQVKIPPLYAV